MNSGASNVLGHLLPGIVQSARVLHGNDSGLEGGDPSSLSATLRLVNSCQGLNATQSGTEQTNISTFPHPLRLCESEDIGDPPLSYDGRTDLCSPLASLRPSHENNVHRSPHLTSCKSPAGNLWHKCFGCLSPPKEDSTEKSQNVDLGSFPASDINTVEETPKHQNALVDGPHSVTHSNEIVPDIALNNSNCNSRVKLNEHERTNDLRENVFIEVNATSVPSSSETVVDLAKILHVVSPVGSTRLSPSHSCNTQLSLTPKRENRGSWVDCSEAPLLGNENDFDCSLSGRSSSNKKLFTLAESKNVSYNLKEVVDSMDINKLANKSFPKNKVAPIADVPNQNANVISEASDLQDSNRVELNFGLDNASISDESNFIADGAGEGSLFRLPIKFSYAQYEGDHSASTKHLLNSAVSSSNKMALGRSPSLVESFSEPSQHFNMSAVHKDIKLMRLKSDELPSFHSPNSPTLVRLSTASTKTSTPLRGCRSILAASLLKNTPSPPVTPIRAQRAVESSLEYPLERLVKKDKVNEVRELSSSLCPNISFVNPDRSDICLPVPCSFFNISSQSESDGSGDIEEFVLDGSVIRKINFSEDFLEEIGELGTNSEPWLQKLLSRTLDSTELKMCNLACRMAWELQEKVYSEIYERLSHMETDDEHYRIEETSRYKYIYVDKIERLWHFLVPLLEQRYWNRCSLNVVNKNLFIYGNRRLNAKQWEFANYNNCVFDVKCVFDYGLYAFDTSNPVFRQENIKKFLVPNYNPEISSEEANK